MLDAAAAATTTTMASTLCVHACSPSPVADAAASSSSSSSSSPRLNALLSLNSCGVRRKSLRFPFQQSSSSSSGSSGGSRSNKGRSSRLRCVRLRAHLGQLPEPQHVDAAITALSHHVPFLAVQEMLVKAEGLLFTLADATAAVTTDAGQTAVDSVQKQSGGDWLSGVTGSLEVALMVSFFPSFFVNLNVCLCLCPSLSLCVLFLVYYFSCFASSKASELLLKNSFSCLRFSVCESRM